MFLEDSKEKENYKQNPKSIRSLFVVTLLTHGENLFGCLVVEIILNLLPLEKPLLGNRFQQQKSQSIKQVNKSCTNNNLSDEINIFCL